MWLDVYEQFSELKESEQLSLFNAMKQDLFPDDPSKITKLDETFFKESMKGSGK